MADMTRELATETLQRHRDRHLCDFGWDCLTLEALDFAIADMKRVEELEAENNRLKDGIEKARNEMKHRYKWLSTSGMREAVEIINEYLGE